MTLGAFAWNIVRTYTLTPVQAGRPRGKVGVTGTFLGTPSQGVWSTARLDFSVPPGGLGLRGSRSP